MSKIINQLIYRWILCGLFLFSVPFSQAASHGLLSNASVIIFSDHIRLALTTNQPVSAKHFTLTHPSRLVIDIDHVALADGLKKNALPKMIKNPYIESIRIGQFTPKTVRFVVLLNASVTIQSTPAHAAQNISTYQLYIDLYPTKQSLNIPKVKALVKTPTNPIVHKTHTTINRNSNAPFVVIIDPGHGGHDVGAISSGKNKEKDVVLAIAKKLKQQLALDPRIKTYLTRETDIYVPLGTRVHFASEHRADLFISIHADAFIKPHAHGSSVFALSEKGATNKAADLLAKNQNSVDQIIGITGHNANIHVRHTLLDLTQTATINNSLKLGQYILNHLKLVNALHNTRVEQASFAVLKAPDIPSILVETAFISNPDEEKLLTDNIFQQKIAKSIFDGIQAYIATLSQYPSN